MRHGLKKPRDGLVGGARFVLGNVGVEIVDIRSRSAREINIQGRESSSHRAAAQRCRGFPEYRPGLRAPVHHAMPDIWDRPTPALAE